MACQLQAHKFLHIFAVSILERTRLGACTAPANPITHNTSTSAPHPGAAKSCIEVCIHNETDRSSHFPILVFVHRSVFLLGDLQEQIDFCFKVYDCMKRDGFITREEMHQLLSPCIVNSPSEEDTAGLNIALIFKLCIARFFFCFYAFEVFEHGHRFFVLL